MSSSFPNRQGVTGTIPSFAITGPTTLKFAAGATSSTGHRGQVLGISGTVMIPANILHHRSCVVSPAEFEAFTWRHQRASDCIWVAAAALLAARPLWLLGKDAHSAITANILLFGPATVLAAVVLLYGLLRKRGHRLSSARMKETPDGWMIRYAFRGLFFRIHRQRFFANKSAAQSFLQN